MARDYRMSTVVTPAGSNWLVSLDAALDALSLTSDGGAQDAQIGRQIGQVSAAIASYCDRTFVRQSYRDQFRSTCGWPWGVPLTLAHAPVAVDGSGNAVLTVTEDGVAVASSEWEVNRDAGLLFRLDSGGAYTSWSGSLIVVLYDAGYDVIPEDVQSAALRWISVRQGAQGRDPLLRADEVPGVQRYEYYQSAVSASSSGVPPDISDMLSLYRVMSL